PEVSTVPAEHVTQMPLSEYPPPDPSVRNVDPPATTLPFSSSATSSARERDRNRDRDKKKKKHKRRSRSRSRSRSKTKHSLPSAYRSYKRSRSQSHSPSKRERHRGERERDRERFGGSTYRLGNRKRSRSRSRDASQEKDKQVSSTIISSVQTKITQTGGWTDGRLGGRTDGRTVGWTDGRADGRTDGRSGGRTGGWAGGRTDGPVDGRTDKQGRVYGRTVERTEGYLPAKSTSWLKYAQCWPKACSPTHPERYEKGAEHRLSQLKRHLHQHHSGLQCRMQGCTDALLSLYAYSLWILCHQASSVIPFNVKKLKVCDEP
ncbi:hypothetical protein QTP86_016892, partial [Hemibagrus guttatus]